MAVKGKKRLTLSQKRSVAGVMFALPFIIGFIFLFLSPLILYIAFGFSRVSPGENSMIFEFIGLDNFRRVILVENIFIRNAFGSLGEMLLTFPSILLYSFFIASLLNQKFRGRTLARAIFFLPVIIASGVAAVEQQSSVIQTSINVLAGTDNPEDTMNMTQIVVRIFGTTMPQTFFNYITTIVGQIYNITLSSGIQIIIFLAGLQTIPPSLYEASSIEGATAWENFWKITLPMISPLILVNAVYTIIDRLGGATNPIIERLYVLSIRNQQYGLSSAMGMVYFTIMFTVLGIVVFFISKMVFYENR